MSWLDWKPAAPPFLDEHGFLSPVHAATHAVLQGGVTDPEREAWRMVKDGGVSKDRAMTWLDAAGKLPDLSLGGHFQPGFCCGETPCRYRSSG